MVRLEPSILGLGLDLLGSYGRRRRSRGRPLIQVRGATIADVVETFRHEQAGVPDQVLAAMTFVFSRGSLTLRLRGNYAGNRFPAPLPPEPHNSRDARAVIGVGPREKCRLPATRSLAPPESRVRRGAP